jgi:hypothetical protein
MVRDTPTEPVLDFHHGVFPSSHEPSPRSPSPWNPEPLESFEEFANGVSKAAITSGRISHQNHAILQEGFKQLHTVIVDLSQRTGLPEKQILHLWNRQSNPPTSPSKNSWNKYSRYFKHHEEEELHRAYRDDRSSTNGTCTHIPHRLGY